MPVLIGLTGVARSGKDTAGRLLAEHHDFRVSGFADAIRQQAAAIDPVVGLSPFGRLVHYNEAIKLYGYDVAKQEFPELRRFLQRLGKEGSRDIYGEDFWFEQWRRSNGVSRRAGIWTFRYPLMAVTDMRYPNEADFVRHLGGMVVRVRRDGVTAANDHDSETKLEQIVPDHVLDNNGTVDELRDALAELVEQCNARTELPGAG